MTLHAIAEAEIAHQVALLAAKSKKEKQVKVKEQNVLKLPDERQTYDYDCGAKCTQVVLAYYGEDIAEEKLFKELGTTENEGTWPDRIEKFFKDRKFKIKAGKLTPKDLQAAIKAKHPVIMLLQAWGDPDSEGWWDAYDNGHYVVLAGYQDGKYIFEDPWVYRLVWLTEKRLLARWHGTCKKDEKCDQYGIVVEGDPKYNPDEAPPMK